jgi:hypothetical protein
VRLGVLLIVGKEVLLVWCRVEFLLADDTYVSWEQLIVTPSASNRDITHRDHAQMTQGYAASIKLFNRRWVVMCAVIEDLIWTARLQDAIFFPCRHIFKVWVNLAKHSLSASDLMEEIS